ncbi:LuxR C-terminal-related transcriptional regulator [Okibacterium endophyticum]
MYGAPRVPASFVDRPALRARIDTGSALTVVRAPAGSGKTLLLADWARSHRPDGMAVWIGCTPERASRLAFWRAVTSIMTDSGQVPSGTIMHTAADAVATTDDLSSLLARSFTQLATEVVLVIDDVHLVDDDIVDDLVRLVADVEMVRVVASTRLRNGLESPSTLRTLDVTVVEPSELTFTHEVVATMLPGADSPQIDAVIDATGGHPLAVHAIVLELAAEPAAVAERLVERAFVVVDENILPAVEGIGGDEFMEFALRTSTAEVLTVELARELSGNSDSERMLRLAEENGIGLWSRVSAGEIFTYTPVVHDVLVRERDRRLEADVVGLKRTVVRWSLANGRPLTALRAAIEIRDHALTEEVIRRAWWSLLMEHGAAARAVLTTVPLTRLSRMPLATMVLGLSFNATGTHHKKAIEMFGLSIASSRAATKQSTADKALLRTMEAVSLRVIGRHDQALKSARAGSQAVDDLSLDQRDALRDLLPTLYAHLGVTFYQQGEIDLALDRLGHSVALGDTLDGVRGLQALSLMSGIQALSGDMPEASALIDDARSREWPDGWVDSYLGSFYQIAEATAALERGRPDVADTHLRRLDRHQHTIEHWPVIALVRGLTDLALGEPALGLERLQSAKRSHASRAGTTGFLSKRLADVESLLQLALGHPSRAVAVVSGSKADVWSALALARVAVVTGDTEQALRHLSLAAGHGLGSSRSRAEHTVLEAAALLRAGKEDAAVSAIRLLAALLDERNLRLPLIVLPVGDFEAVLALADSAGLEHASGILRDTPIPHPLRSLKPVPSLTDRELVVLRVLAREGSVPEIARSLHVSPNTIKSQLRSIYRKLDVESRDQALAASQTFGFL